MAETQIQLQEALDHAAECQLISERATDHKRRENYERLAIQYRELADELVKEEQALIARDDPARR